MWGRGTCRDQAVKPALDMLQCLVGVGVGTAVEGLEREEETGGKPPVSSWSPLYLT